MDWAIKEKDKRKLKHCLYTAFMTAASNFVGNIVLTGASYSAAWHNSRLLCNATEAATGKMPYLVLEGFTSQHRPCIQTSCGGLHRWHSYTLTLTLALIPKPNPRCHSAAYAHASGYLVGPCLEEKKRVDYSWFPISAMELPLVQFNTHTICDWIPLT